MRCGNLYSPTFDNFHLVSFIKPDVVGFALRCQHSLALNTESAREKKCKSLERVVLSGTV